MVKRVKYFVVLAIVLALSGIAQAGPPLPLHTIEGTSGVCLSGTAYLANPAEGGKAFGLPSVSTTAVFLGEKDLESFAVTENLWGPIEVGYAYERFGLGDWPDDVKTAAGASVSQHLGLHNLNFRIMTIKEGDFECPWMPAVTLGAHLKWNEGQTKLDDDLGGLLDTLGSDHSRGMEFTLAASKTVNEGSVIAFLTDRLAFAAEYRQKSDLMDQFSTGGYHLVKAENDWWTLCLGYVLNDHTTISSGYANLGNVANHREESAFGIQVKHEF
ncbi:MAG: DUF3034 family protein [Planctomycetota bacterium]|jgi:hypothetical protein